MLRIKFFTKVVLGCLTIFAAAGCNQLSTNDIDLSSMLIDVNVFPTGWFFTGFGERGLEDYRSRDSVRVHFNPRMFPDSHGSLQNVYRFKSVRSAERDFASELQFYEMFYSVPPEWKYVSDLADESYFSCWDEAERCFWVARYKNIVVEFQGPVTSDLLTLTDFENIVKEIEAKANRLIFERGE